MATPASELRVTAFLGNPDRPDIRNAIHSTQGAQEYGYRAALVGGATVFGWATPAIIEVLGSAWLDTGWAELAFRRPTYPGDELTISVTAQAEQSLMRITGADGNDRITGELGVGPAPWLDAVLLKTPFRPGEPALNAYPRLIPDIAPVGRQLAPLAVHVSAEEMQTFARDKQASEDPTFVGPTPRMHPAWVVGRPPNILHHSYDYGPAIHARTHIQWFAPMVAPQTIVTTATFREAYPRNEHHYCAYDMTTYTEDGRTELVRQRHTTVFSVAKKG